MKKIYIAFSKEKFLFFFSLLILSLFILNRYMYVNRYSGYLYTEGLNYNELYFSEDAYHIQGYSKKAAELQLNILPVPARSEWQITDSKGGNYKSVSELPVIKLVAGTETYTISTTGNKAFKPIELEIEHSLDNEYTCVLQCSMPIIEYKLFPVERWCRLNKNISQDEINETKRILKDEIMVSDSNSTTEKIEKIGKYLIAKLRTSEGGPSGEFKQLSPLNQYNLACSKKSEIDCANYTDIYHLFANCAGVPTRKIGVGGALDYVAITGHVFNESYIKEQGKWAFVDLTSKKLMVLNLSNEVLNTIDLLNAKNAKTPEGKIAVFITPENKIDSVPYGKVNQSENQYFKESAEYYVIKEDINNDMSFSESFKEYRGKTSHYGPYYNGTKHIDNSKYYLQSIIFEISMVLFFIWGIVLIGKIISVLIR